MHNELKAKLTHALLSVNGKDVECTLELEPLTGPDVILTVDGQGYKLTPVGCSTTLTVKDAETIDWLREKMETSTRREILHAMQANRAENERLLDLAEKAGIHTQVNNLGGGWTSLDYALKHVKDDDIDLDEEI